MKRIASTCIIAFGLVFGGGAAAHAGEYNGKGGSVPGGVNGKSECSYSGRDVPDSVEGNPPGFDDDALTSQRNYTQNYGLFVSLGLKGAVPSPGEACRGNAGH
ncbi:MULTISPECIES: hypothetical protein [unclassified Knoellia]|uniref:hypothetical protein n=1 Tax=Knoellia altitudinis TaxID=3404795 RepID=UPI003610C4BD